MPADAPILYLPVETAARELDAKLLLSLFALRAGMTVYICSSIMVRRQLYRLRRGMFLISSFQERNSGFVARLRALGHRVVAWDEEGLVWLSPQAYVRRRVGASTLRKVDALYAWGPEHVAVLRDAGVTAPILPLGNPRADLLRPRFLSLYEEDTRRIREEYGDFILVNSNFGWLNFIGHHGRAPSDAEIARLSGHPQAFIGYRRRVFESLVSLIGHLARRLPTWRIVVRPHPSEEPEIWRRRLAGLPNVTVRYDDRLPAWLLACRAMIHNGCTTAVEYAMLGRVPISYDAEFAEAFDPVQPRRVSLSAREPEEVLRLVAETPAAPERLQALYDMVGGWGEEKLSAETIVEHMTTIERTEGLPSLPRRLEALLYAGRKALQGRMGRAGGRRHLEHRFPSLAASDLRERLRRLAACLDWPAPAISVRQEGDRLYRLCLQEGRAEG